MIARDYQIECRDAILAAWGEKPWHKDGEDSYRTVVSNLPTSSGKTIITGFLFDALKDRGKCLYIADTDELCEQPVKKFYKFGIHAGVEKAGSHASRHAQVVVGSAQTLMRQNRLDRFPPDHFQYIVVDEAHRGSDRNKKITDYFAGAKVCGQTATAFRAKLKDLSQWYQHIAFEMGIFDLIDAGFIAPIKVLTLPVNIDISGVGQKASPDGQDYDKDELSTTIRPYYEAIVKLMMEHAGTRQILVFLPLIRSSEDFVSIARDMGVNARHVDGKSPNRKELIEGFARKHFQVLSNSSLLTTGWDCPAVDCLLNLSPTRSAGLYRQKVGRILRVEDGLVDDLPKTGQAAERRARIAVSTKPDALILDLLWQTERFGLQGPADLIAGNDVERRAVQIKLAGLREAKDLELVSAEVQEDRETKLKEELDRVAKRRSRGLVDARLFGVTMHDRTLVDYEPVTNWQAEAVTDKQAAFLIRNGVDPASVTGKGHASAITNKIYGRRVLGLASFRTVQALDKAGIPGATHMKEQDAYNYLKGDFPFPFGRPAENGQTFKQVNAGYWQWLSKQAFVKTEWPIVYQHMQELGYVVGRGQQHITTESEPLTKLHFKQTVPSDDQIPF